VIIQAAKYRSIHTTTRIATNLAENIRKHESKPNCGIPRPFNKFQDWIFTLLHLKWNETWHLTFRGGCKKFIISAFVLLLRKMMKQWGAARQSYVMKFLLAEGFPHLKFIDDCLKWWRRLLLAKSGVSERFRLSGKNRSPFYMLMDLVRRIFLQGC